VRAGGVIEVRVRQENRLDVARSNHCFDPAGLIVESCIHKDDVVAADGHDPGDAAARAHAVDAREHPLLDGS
jgi:hypothetical protein